MFCVILGRLGPAPGLTASVSSDLIVFYSTHGLETWAGPLWALFHADHGVMHLGIQAA